jgi:hypothetical protein
VPLQAAGVAAVVRAAAAQLEPLEEAVASGAPVRQPVEAGPAALDVAAELLQVAAEG